MAGLLKEIDQRRAKRALSEKKIPDDIVERMMNAATCAPSCFNSQPWWFIWLLLKEGAWRNCMVPCLAPEKPKPTPIPKVVSFQCAVIGY